MSSCTNAELAAQLLTCSDAEIAGRAKLVSHLGACDGCRSYVEQRRRMAAHWDSRELSQSELLRLRARLFRSAKEPLRSRKVAVLVGAFAVALFTAAAVAATYGRLEKKLPVRVETESHGSASRPRLADPPAALAPPIADQPHIADSAAAPSAPRAVGSGARAKLPDANTDPRWSKVTEAMRRHDSVGAEQALKALTSSADVRSRDAARLTLAELWMQSGRAAAARPVLRELAQRGATQTVRARAVTLLQQLGE